MNKVASQVLEHSVSSCHICCLVPLGREFFSPNSCNSNKIIHLRFCLEERLMTADFEFSLFLSQDFSS